MYIRLPVAWYAVQEPAPRRHDQCQFMLSREQQQLIDIVNIGSLDPSHEVTSSMRWDAVALSHHVARMWLTRVPPRQIGVEETQRMRGRNKGRTKKRQRPKALRNSEGVDPSDPRRKHIPSHSIQHHEGRFFPTLCCAMSHHIASQWGPCMRYENLHHPGGCSIVTDPQTSHIVCLVQ